MKKFALIGRDVSASPSPEIHKFISAEKNRRIIYDKISVPQENFLGEAERLLREYDGFNVTVPYKIKIVDCLSSLIGDAEIFGAANTVKCGEKSGCNTDGAGFSLMLATENMEVKGESVLVLGAGGAGRSVANRLLLSGANVFIFDINETAAKEVEKKLVGVTSLNGLAPSRYRLIVNATGVGMHESTGISPVQADILSHCDVACDLIYSPEKSEFLRIAESLGKKILNGAPMLFYQAYYSQCVWFGDEPNADEAKRLFTKYSTEKE